MNRFQFNFGFITALIGFALSLHFFLSEQITMYIESLFLVVVGIILIIDYNLKEIRKEIEKVRK